MKYTVYLIRHIGTGTVLYVGKTNNFKKRAHQHLTLKTNTKEWLSSIGTMNVLIEEVAKFDNETDALKYEDELILKYDTITNGYNNNRSGLIQAENKDEYNREYQREYEKTDKRKEYRREYKKTDKWKEYLREYRKTDKYKEWNREYEKTDKRKEWLIEYRKTEKYKDSRRKYEQTDKVKERRREYSKTDKFKEYHRKWQRDYYYSKKMGISIAEYRKLKNDQDSTLEQNKKQPIQLTINF